MPPPRLPAIDSPRCAALALCVCLFTHVGIAAAQPPLVVGPEIDPTTPGAVALNGAVLGAPGGFGFYLHWSGVIGLDVLRIVDADLSPDGPLRRVAAPVLAVGATTYAMAGAGGWLRASRADDRALEAPDPPPPGSWTVIARGDDYVVHRRFTFTRAIGVWRAGERAGATILEDTPCADCVVDTVACSETTCVAAFASATSGVQVAEIVAGGPSILGPTVDLGVRTSLPVQLFAMDAGWTLAAFDSDIGQWVLSFYDTDWALLGRSDSPVPAPFGCAADYCVAVDSGPWRVVRFTADGREDLPYLAMANWRTVTAPLVCRGHACVASMSGNSRSRPGIYRLDPTAGTIDAMPPDTWQAAASQRLDGLFLTDAGPWVRLRDERDYFRSESLVRAFAPPADPTPEPAVLATARPLAAGSRHFVGVTSGIASVVDESGALTATVDLTPWCMAAMDASWAVDHWDLACFDGASAVRMLALDEAGALSPPGLTLLGVVPSIVSVVSAGEHVVLQRRNGMTEERDALLFTRDGSVIRDVTGAFGRMSVLSPGAMQFSWAEWGAPFPYGVQVSALWLDGSHRALGPPLTSPTAFDPSTTITAFDGTWTFVVTLDRERSSAPWRYRMFRVGIDGERPEVAPYELGWQPADSSARPQIVSDRNGRTWVAYARYVGDTYFTQRVRVREVTTGDALGHACTDGATCGSGVCLAGICCSRACDGACDVCTVVEGARADGACTDLCPAPDAGTADAGAVDASTTSDGALFDGGPIDGGPIDAGGDDARVGDAAQGEDASFVDAFVRVDAARDGDDGAALDGGPVDEPDASDDWAPTGGGACGCRVAAGGRPSALTWLVLGWLASLWLARRRRRR